MRITETRRRSSKYSIFHASHGADGKEAASKIHGRVRTGPCKVKRKNTRHLLDHDVTKDIAHVSLAEHLLLVAGRRRAPRKPVFHQAHEHGWYTVVRGANRAANFLPSRVSTVKIESVGKRSTYLRTIVGLQPQQAAKFASTSCMQDAGADKVL